MLTGLLGLQTSEQPSLTWETSIFLDQLASGRWRLLAICR